MFLICVALPSMVARAEDAIHSGELAAGGFSDNEALVVGAAGEARNCCVTVRIGVTDAANGATEGNFEFVQCDRRWPVGGALRSGGGKPYFSSAMGGRLHCPSEGGWGGQGAQLAPSIRARNSSFVGNGWLPVSVLSGRERAGLGTNAGRCRAIFMLTQSDRAVSAASPVSPGVINVISPRSSMSRITCRPPGWTGELNAWMYPTSPTITGAHRSLGSRISYAACL